MLNLWVNAVPVLLHRKTVVTNFIFVFLSLSLHPASLPLWDMHTLRSCCTVMHVTHTSEQTNTDFTVYIATLGMLIKVNGREVNLLNPY